MKIENINRINQTEESSQTRSNTIREEQQINDQFTIKGEDV